MAENSSDVLDVLLASCSFYCKNEKARESSRETDSFAKLSSIRRLCSQLGNMSYLVADNRTTCDLLDNTLKRYSDIIDDKHGVNNYADGVQSLVKYVTNAHCQKWKSGFCMKDECDVEEYLLPVLCDSTSTNNNNSCYSNNDCGSNRVTEEEIQVLIDAYNRVSDFSSANTVLINNKQECFQKDYNSVLKSHNILPNKRKSEFFKEEHLENKSKRLEENIGWIKPNIPTIASGREFNSSMSKPKPTSQPQGANRLLTFKTASAELKSQNMKKFGGKGDTHKSSNDNGGQQQKRSLGSRSVSSKFVVPVKSDKVSYDNEKNVSDCDLEDIDPRLHHIEPKMIEMIRSEIMDSTNPLTWDDIAGLHFAKSTIQEIVVWPMLRPDIFTGLRRPPKGILLFGPPGTGKTLIAKCIASQSKSTFFSISASSLTSKWIGDGEKMVRALFAVARVDQPSVVFIDEIDSLLSRRSDTEHESSRRIKTEFLVQLDGATTGEEDRLLIIGATNRPHELDEAARRRLVKRLYIPLPDHQARIEMVTRLISKERNSLTADEIRWISDSTDGYSGADVKIVCQEAALGPIRSISYSQIEHISSEEVRPVSIEDFKNALNRVRSSVSADDLKCYIEWDKTYGSGSL